MFTEINIKLEEAQKGIYRIKKIDSMLNELRSEQENLKNKVFKLKNTLAKENSDVDKLNKKSLASIFYSVIGKLEGRLEEEEREALAAKLKYDQAVLDLENIEYEIDKLLKERSEYEDCKGRYDSLYIQKKDMLLKSDESTAKRILDITQRLSDSQNRIRELREAIQAGNNAADCLNNALDSLSSAEGWGTWDLFGGGLIADLAKHSRLDDTKYEVERAQTLLRKFKTELADVRINSDIHIETDGFARFADIFFDGFIADWFMQSKIRDSYENVSSVKHQVENVINKLTRLESEETVLVKSLKDELNNLIIKS